MSRHTPPGIDILVFVKTKHWEKKDTKFMIFLHKHAQSSMKMNKCEERMAFGQRVNFN